MRRLALTLVVTVLAAAACDRGAATSKDAIDFLFVQSADRVVYEDGTLALEGINPAVVFFSDRPNRIAGHLTMPAFLELWEEGADSFAEDPPNAVLSALVDESMTEAVVTLTNPRLEGSALRYDVELLEGALPSAGGVSSLFIDGLVRGGARGAALGAVGGAIAGDAGKGAKIGAGVGAAGGLIRR